MMSDEVVRVDLPHLSEEELILHYYREGGVAEQRRAGAHLASCDRCREELTRLTQVLALVEAHADERAPEGFERVMWARVQARLPGDTASVWRGWWSARRLAFGAAAATLVVAAFVAGRWSGGPEREGQPPAPAVGPSVASGGPGGVLLVAVGDHLERSQMVLVELLNTEPADREGLWAERERAADLVAANRLLRQSAGFAGEAAVSDLLDDLERILIEIANGADEGAVEALDALRARIESKGILFRMRVVASEVRQRERDRVGVRRAPES
jgi:hypothetical protein